jgi:hypothetical protein
MIFAGQPLGWAIRGMQGGGDSPIFPVGALCIGIALMMQGRWLIAPRFYANPPLFAIPTLLLLIPILLMSFANFRENIAWGVYPAFLAVIGLCIALTPVERFETFPRALMVLCLLASVDPFIELLVRDPLSVDAAGGRLQLAGNANVLMTGFIGCLTVITAVIVGDEDKGNSALTGLVASLAFTIGLAAVIMSDTRSDEIVLFPVAGAYLVLRRLRQRQAAKPGSGRQRIVFGSVLVGGLASLPALATVFFSKNALKVFEASSELRHSGFLNSLSGGSYAADTSTAARFATIEFAYKHLDLAGHGMMHQSVIQGGIYTHMTYLQAYYDLGVLGGTFYILIAAAIPAALCLVRIGLGSLKSTDIFIILLLLYVQADHFTHGHPYAWQGLAPALLCYLLLFGRTDAQLDELEMQNEGGEKNIDTPPLPAT